LESHRGQARLSPSHESTARLSSPSFFTCSLATAIAGEVLYNGIQLPDVWPPKREELTREPPADAALAVAPPAVHPD